MSSRSSGTRATGQLDLASPPSAARRGRGVPRRWGLRPSDATLIALGNAVLIVAMWVRHGQFPTSPIPRRYSPGPARSALLGTYSALVQVVLMSRSPWLDDLFGIDRLAGWHRWLGFATLYLLSAHVVLTTAGYAMTTAAPSSPRPGSSSPPTPTC